MGIMKSKPNRVTVTEDKDDGQMPIEIYGAWFTAITENNTHAMAKTMEETSATEQNRLLNGRFIYPNIPKNAWKHSQVRQPMCKYERPLFVAVVHRNADAMWYLIEHGADVLSKDVHGGTLVHAMLWASANDEDNADAYDGLYEGLMAVLGTEEKKDLLLSQDNDKMLPIELASAIGNVSFLVKIFQTEGVYRHPKDGLGLYAYNLYDITSYEVWDERSRRKRNPIVLMTYLTKKNIDNGKNKTAFMTQCLQRWMQYTLALYHLPMLIWGLMRVTFHFTFLAAFGTVVESISKIHKLCADSKDKFCSIKTFSRIVLKRSRIATKMTDLEEINKAYNTSTAQPHNLLNTSCDDLLHGGLDTDNYTKHWLSLALYLYALVLLVWCVRNVIVQFKQKASNVRRKYLVAGKRLVKAGFYWGVTALFSFSIITCFMSLSYPRVSYCSYIIASVMNLFCLLYFLQFTVFGYFAVTIQNMFYDLMSFFLILLLFLAGFGQTIHYVLASGTVCTMERPKFFLYESFKVMLNMVDLSPWQECLEVEITLLHFLYILIIPILLVNFLIALMSNTVGEMSENRSFIIQLTYLDAYLSQAPFFCRIFHRYIQRKYLIHDNGNIYLPVLEIDT